MERLTSTRTLSEKDLLNLPKYIDDLLMMDTIVRQAGYVKFNVEDRCGGTTLPEFIAKFERSCGPSPSKITPISLRQKDIYGHISVEEKSLLQEDVEDFKEVMRDPSSYSPELDNCCMAALNEEGYEGLLEHFFEDELPKNAQPPFAFCPSTRSLKSIKISAATKKKQFSLLQHQLSTLSTAQQGAKLQDILGSAKRRRIESKAHSCACERCIHSDECYNPDDPSDQEFKAKATAAYYMKGFLYGNGIEVTYQERNLITANFSLSYLDFISLTSMFDTFYAGVNTPYLYAGSLHSFCPIHVEDLSLFSVNFLHYGHPKLWLIVPPCAVAKLTYAIMQDVEHSGFCLGMLSHKYHVITPSWLRRHEIPFNTVIQRSGQGIIVTPNAAHLVVNLGPNIAEASNFGTVSWIPYGIAYPKCSCFSNPVHEDISTIVQSYYPDLLQSHLNNEVPKEVPNDPGFLKCVVLPAPSAKTVELQVSTDEKEKPQSTPESTNERLKDKDEEKTQSDSKVSLCTDNEEEETDSIPETSLSDVDSEKLEKKCPVCKKEYKGGHKKRLLEHVQKNHKKLSVKEKKRVDSELEEMFPERNTIPRVPCGICGKTFAGTSSLKRHQKCHQ